MSEGSQKNHTKHLLISNFLFLISILLFSCSQPFQPTINYTPQLVMYSILFADKPGVYVTLYSTTNSVDGDVNEPVHGAKVGLVTSYTMYNPADSSSDNFSDTLGLSESFIVSNHDTSYFYYSPVSISAGGTYGITAEKQGYKPVSAYVTVPLSYITIPDIYSYAALRLPDSSNVDPVFQVSLGGSSAYFVQLLLEYRGFDAAGNFQTGFVDATGSSPMDPFIQVTTNSVTFSVNRSYYSARLQYAKQAASSLRQSHMYADIVVTQLDDPLYRFYLTSGRWNNPLAMRTDKAVFSNVANGAGIVGAAAVDTTRIFLF